MDAEAVDPATADQVYLIAQSAVQYASRAPGCAAVSLLLEGASAGIRLSVSWEYRNNNSPILEAGEKELECISYRTRLLGGTHALDQSAVNRGLIVISIPLAP